MKVMIMIGTAGERAGTYATVKRGRRTLHTTQTLPYGHWDRAWALAREWAVAAGLEVIEASDRD